MSIPDSRITLQDISKKAKVSINTVAKVLAGQAESARISEKTAARIRKIAKEAGYVPNIMARNLRSKRTGMIGVFVADMTDSTCALIAQLILKQLHARRLSPLLTVAEIGPDLCMQEWLQNRIEGLIFCGTTDFVTDDFLEDIRKARIVPLIAGCTFRNPEHPGFRDAQISTISVNNYAGIEMAIEHLLKTEKRRIVHLGGPVWHGDAWERRIAYEAIISQHHKPMVIGPDDANHFWRMGYNGMARLHRNRTNYDAIVAYDDQMAIGVIKWLTEHKLRIPTQVAIVGFDNSPESQSCTPALTTISQPLEQIAEKSVSLMIDYLRKKPLVEKIQIPPSLVIRESS